MECVFFVDGARARRGPRGAACRRVPRDGPRAARREVPRRARSPPLRRPSVSRGTKLGRGSPSTVALASALRALRSYTHARIATNTQEAADGARTGTGGCDRGSATASRTQVLLRRRTARRVLKPGSHRGVWNMMRSRRAKTPRQASAVVTSAADGCACGIPDDVVPLVLRQLRCPVDICTAAQLGKVWRGAANHPEVWAEADVGDAVRRYVAHHRCLARDQALARAGREALLKLSLFRAFVAWRAMVLDDVDAIKSVWRGQPSERSGIYAVGTNSVVCDVTLDTHCCTLGFLIDTVLRGLGHVGGNVSAGAVELICGTAEDFEGGTAAYVSVRAKPLAELGVVDGSTLDIDDDCTNLQHRLVVHHELSGTERFTAVVSLAARLEHHREVGRARLVCARLPVGLKLPVNEKNASETWERQSFEDTWERMDPSPEAAIIAQDSQSCDLANEALFHILKLPNRLSQLKRLDLSELGMGIQPLLQICSIALRSLESLNLDYCRLVDFPDDQYTTLRKSLVQIGVSVSDVQDVTRLKVVGECSNGPLPPVFFKIRGRRELFKLMSIYARRQGILLHTKGTPDMWRFTFRPAQGGDAVVLKASDTTRAVGIPDNGTINAELLQP